MDKKQLIINVLTKLKPYRNLAEGLLALVESDYSDEKCLDGLVQLLATSIKDVKNEGDKAKIEEGIAMLKKLKKEETLDQIKDEESAENLLQSM